MLLLTFYSPQGIGSSTYCRDLQVDIKFHLVFHISHLKELLGFDDNLASIKTLVTFEDLASKRHRTKRILNSKTKRL